MTTEAAADKYRGLTQQKWEQGLARLQEVSTRNYQFQLQERRRVEDEQRRQQKMVEASLKRQNRAGWLKAGIQGLAGAGMVAAGGLLSATGAGAAVGVPLIAGGAGALTSGVMGGIDAASGPNYSGIQPSAQPQLDWSGLAKLYAQRQYSVPGASGGVNTRPSIQLPQETDWWDIPSQSRPGDWSGSSTYGRTG